MTETDEDVIRRASAEPHLFGLLFDRHFETIARFCIRRVGPIQGEDLAGDVFCWAFENLETFDPDHGGVRSWLYRIANNLVRNAQRRAGRQGMAYVRWSTREGSHETDPAAQIAAAVDAESDLCAVTAVLELQSTEDVETLLMFAWEQLSYAEIAEVLSIPIGTVSSRISRIRRHLHEVLDGELVHLKCATRFLGGTE
jgi:RNA polymerase sigma-70 factor (ECF subfamily)